MKTVLAFDVYGTLIDTSGVVAQLSSIAGDRAAQFAALWRDKQLEYSFRRGLMRRYESFEVCIRDSLELASQYLRIELGSGQRERLLGAYRRLPAFAEVADSLESFDTGSFALYALSNGTTETVDELLRESGIRHRFIDIVSVDEIGTFKPDPDVYLHFLKRAGARAADAWLISSNSFDVIGALATGMRAAWVRRSPDARFDPWGVEPTLVVDDLARLRDGIAARSAAD